MTILRNRIKNRIKTEQCLMVVEIIIDVEA